MRMRRSRIDQEGQGAQGARRARRLHRRGPRRRQGRRPALRLADHRRQRPADEGAAASLPRAGQGALRRRPGRGRRSPRRSTQAQRRGGAGRGGLRRAARGGRRVQARAKGAPQLHDIAPDNTCYVWALGDKAAADAAFAKAAHVTKLEFVNNRLIPNAIEPRAAIGAYSRADDSYTLYVASQNPHVERLLMTAFVLGLPEHKLRVVAPDVGGGFGSKIYLYAEDVVVTWAVQAAQPPGEVDRRALRVLHVGRARARPPHGRRAGDGQGRQVPRRCA